MVLPSTRWSLASLDAHLHPQFGIEIAERLIEQEDIRVAHDSATDGDALTLATRELCRLACK